MATGCLLGFGTVGVGVMAKGGMADKTEGIYVTFPLAQVTTA